MSCHECGLLRICRLDLPWLTGCVNKGAVVLPAQPTPNELGLEDGAVRDLRTGAIEKASGQMIRVCINAPEGHVEVDL